MKRDHSGPEAGRPPADEALDGCTRRSFIQTLGVSAAAASALKPVAKGAAPAAQQEDDAGAPREVPDSDDTPSVAAGLLERFRDGHYVYHRVPAAEGSTGEIRRLLALLPKDEPEFRRDVDKLRELRDATEPQSTGDAEDDRFLHKALVELTVAAPLGGHAPHHTASRSLLDRNRRDSTRHVSDPTRTL